MQDVRSAGGQRSERDLRADDTIHHFVDGAVAAAREKQVEAAIDGRAPEFAGHVRASGRQQFHVATGVAEAVDSGVETRRVRSPSDRLRWD